MSNASDLAVRERKTISFFQPLQSVRKSRSAQTMEIKLFGKCAFEPIYS